MSPNSRMLVLSVALVFLACLAAGQRRGDLIGNELANYTHAAELGWSGNTDYCFWTGLSCNTRGELVQIDLHGRNLQGGLPTGWSKFKELRALRLNGNDLSGKLPEQWSEMVSLEYLYLNQNKLSGHLSENVFKEMKNMKHLYLHDNLLTGNLPGSWGEMKQLKVLHLERNRFSGDLPQRWSGMTDIEYMYLADNDLQGSLPSEWKDLTALKHIHLQNNKLSGQIPSPWAASMTGLQALHLSNNGMDGRIPEDITKLRQLAELGLGNNLFTGDLAAGLSGLRLLRQLYLQNNMLTGRLPDSWAQLSALEELHLDGNQLTGSLPPDWGAMRSLKYLYFANNNLSGGLPVPWAALSLLVVFNAPGNAIEGSLPEMWAQLKSLEVLVMNDNQLDGPLPGPWEQLQNLKYLYVPDNGLTGVLPPGWSKMAALEHLVLRRNNLEGAVPLTWRNGMDRLRKLDATENRGLCVEPGFKNDDVFWASAVKNLETCVLQREVSYLPVASAVPLSKQPGASQAEQNANQKASVPPRPPTVQEEAGEYMADADQQQTWSKPMPYHPMPVSVGEMAGNKQGALNTNPFEQNGLSPSSQEFAVEPETTGLQTIHQPKPKYSNALEEMGGEFMGSPGMGYVVVAFLLVLFLALAAACILLCYRSRTDAPTEEHEEHEEQPGNAVDAAEDTIDKKGKSAVGPENEDPSRISSTATPSTTSVKEAQREGLDVACPKHFMPSNSTVSRVPPGFTYHAGYSSPVQSDISSICGLQQYRVQRPYPVGHEQPSVMRRSGDGYPAIAMRRSTEDSDGWTHPPVRISNPTSNSRRKAREHSTNDGILYM